MFRPAAGLIFVQDGFVGSVGDVVSVGDEVEVRVLSVDAATGKIALTMKGGGEQGDTGSMGAQAGSKSVGLFGGKGVNGDANPGKIALLVKGGGEQGGTGWEWKGCLEHGGGAG